MSRRTFLICWAITAPWSGLVILVALTFAGVPAAGYAVVWVMTTFSDPWTHGNHTTWRLLEGDGWGPRLGNLYFLISAVILGYMINDFLRDTAHWWRWYREWRNMLRG